MAIHRNWHVKAPAGKRLRRVLAVAVGVSLCVSGYVLSGAQASAPQRTGNAPISLRATQIGTILVNAKGHTLYLFTHDSHGASACAGKCAKYWPPAIAPAKPAGGTGVKAALLGTTLRKDGRRQLTYNHHPLYGFALDKQAGQANGQGSTAFGGQWWAVSSTGRPVKKLAPSASPGTTTTSTDTTTTAETTTYSRYP